MSQSKKSLIQGTLFILLFAIIAYLIAQFDFVNSLSFSPLIVGIILGMIYANTVGSKVSQLVSMDFKFCSKKILRFGIILYGFKVTLNDVAVVGIPAIVLDAIIVVCTISLGLYIGKLLKMDKEITLLTAVGSSICGAAAVLGAEAAMKVKPYKTAVAVSTVVIFGTMAMFLYPILYKCGVFSFDDPNLMGIFTGATVHEVAHVVGAGNAIGTVNGVDVGATGIIVKMIRVMMLVPVLLVIAFSMARKASTTEGGEKGKISIPWFAILFLLMIVVNSINVIPAQVVGWIKLLCDFCLTMAMTALGAETSFDKFKKAGAKPFVLALILFFWLIIGGYLLTKYFVPIMM